jgi:hypothetical protein
LARQIEAIAGFVRVHEDARAGQARQRFLQDLQPLGGQVRPEEGRAGDVAAGSGQARHDPGLDRVADDCHDDRHDRRRPLGRQRGRGALGDDDVGLELDEFRGQGGQALVLAVGPPVVDRDVLPLDVPVVAQPEPQGLDLRHVAGRRGPAE